MADETSAPPPAIAANDDHSSWKLRDSLIHDEVDGKLIVVDLEGGLYFQITDIAAKLWARIAEGEAKFDELLATAKHHSPLRGSELGQQLRALLATLVKHKLLQGSVGIDGGSEASAYAKLGQVHSFANLRGVKISS